MAEKISIQLIQWVGQNVIDTFLESIEKRSLDLETTKESLLHLIENPDKRAIWGIMKTYDDEFKKFDDTIRRATLPAMRKNTSLFASFFGIEEDNWLDRKFGLLNIHFFWELLMGRKFFHSPLLHIKPIIHPEAKALVHVHLMVFLTSVFHPDSYQYCEDLVQKHLAPEIKLEEDYMYGHIWTIQACYGSPKKFSLYDSEVGKLWDAADVKWYQAVKQMYKRLVLDKATKVCALTDEDLYYWKAIFSRPGNQQIDNGEMWWTKSGPE